METYNQNTATVVKDKEPRESKRNGRFIGGAFIVVIGLIILSRQAGLDFPYWFFSWATLWMAVGLYIGFRHGFKGVGWLIPIAVGCFLLVDEFYPYYDLDDYIVPVIIIAIGLYIMFKPRKTKELRNQLNTDGSPMASSEDILDSTVVFGSVKKMVISKSFKGGEAMNVFGGTELNLMQADITGKVVLDMTIMFGGAKLIIPPHWRIESEELVTIFGGIEDKRPILSDVSTVDQSKIVVLKGTCIFGGIDIKSY